MPLAILSARDPGDARGVAELLAELRAGFAAVSSDAEKGRARAAQEVTGLRALNAPPPVIALAEAAVDGALWIQVREGVHAVEFLLAPGLNLRIAHDACDHDLVHRIATHLGCHLTACG